MEEDAILFSLFTEVEREPRQEMTFILTKIIPKEASTKCIH